MPPFRYCDVFFLLSISFLFLIASFLIASYGVQNSINFRLIISTDSYLNLLIIYLLVALFVRVVSRSILTKIFATLRFCSEIDGVAT